VWPFSTFLLFHAHEILKTPLCALDLSMLLDNFTYVTSHDQLAGTVQGLVTRLGSTLVGCGVYPRFSDCNFECDDNLWCYAVGLNLPAN
jgi:hypothetical protein